MTDNLKPPRSSLDPVDGERGLPAPDSGIPDLAQPARPRVSMKALVGLAFLVITLIAASAVWIQHLIGSKKADEDTKLVGDKPAAASLEPKRLDLAVAARPGASTVAAVAAMPKIPAIVPTEEELAEPIGVRKTGMASPALSKSIPPEDAPAVLVSSRPGAFSAPPPRGSRGDAGDGAGGSSLDHTRRNLEAYQRQLHGLLESMTRAAQPSSPEPLAGLGAVAPSSGGAPSGGPSGAGGSPPQAGLFGGQLQSSATPRVRAASLPNRSLVIPKGTSFTCALKTRVVSATSGLIGCQVQRNVFGDDGRVLLVERGSHIDGEYRITSIRPGTVRIPVVWTRIRTPNGIVVDLDSPGTGALGESGIDGYVDNRWFERIGAALLLSLIDDSVKLIAANQANGTGDTVVLSSTTSTTSTLAEKVLDSTINIPPLIYRNQGGIVGVYVARDVDFSSVYELQPSQR